MIGDAMNHLPTNRMLIFNRQNITKALSIGIMLMGIVHIVATYTPLIVGKLALLPEGVSDAFTYFSLMCGALLILGGGVTYTLSSKIAEYPFVQKTYMLALAIMNVDGILAVCYMRHNPCAWIIFTLTMGLMFASVTSVRDPDLKKH